MIPCNSIIITKNSKQGRKCIPANKLLLAGNLNPPLSLSLSTTTLHTFLLLLLVLLPLVEFCCDNGTYCLLDVEAGILGAARLLMINSRKCLGEHSRGDRSELLIPHT